MQSFNTETVYTACLLLAMHPRRGEWLVVADVKFIRTEGQLTYFKFVHGGSGFKAGDGECFCWFDPAEVYTASSIDFNHRVHVTQPESEWDSAWPPTLICNHKNVLL